MGIFKAIKKRIADFSAATAEAIEHGDWWTVARNVGIAAIWTGCGLLLCLLLLAAIWSLLKSFLGKVILTMTGTPLVLYFLYLSYQANLEDAQKLRKRQDARNHLEVWAEDVYGYVRDAMFLVFRALSEYTVIVKPSTPSAIELPNGISIKDSYVVFSFFARVRDTVDPVQVKRDLTRTLNQMLRAHELQGIPSDLVQINGSYYAPLQVLGVVDFGDSINVSVVFADEKTVELAKARRRLNLEQSKNQQSPVRDVLYDDQL